MYSWECTLPQRLLVVRPYMWAETSIGGNSRHLVPSTVRHRRLDARLRVGLVGADGG
jgi:hypothetical protein